MKDLSIIIPHYNCPKKLKRLLFTIDMFREDGIYDKTEVIVVDDNSTKDILELKQLGQQYPEVKFIFAEKNKGAGAARNIGLKEATGKWVLFADSDDYFNEDMWAAVSANFMAKEDIILFPPTSVIDETNILADRHRESARIVSSILDEHDEKAELNARYMMTLNLSRMIRRELIEHNQIRFDESMRYFEDAIFAMECGHVAEIIGARKTIIYCITQSKDSETYKDDETSDLLRRKCSYLRAKRLCDLLTPHQQEVLNAGKGLVLKRYNDYKRTAVSKAMYKSYLMTHKY